jgi:hypothetical protein
MAEEDNKGKPRQVSLPEDFIAKREEFYLLNTRLNQALSNRITTASADSFLSDYLDRADYIINRIVPKLRSDDAASALMIQEYIRGYLNTYQENFPSGVPQLNKYHYVISKLLEKYCFDQITPTMISV